MTDAMKAATKALRVFWSESGRIYLVKGAGHGYRVVYPNGEHELRVPVTGGGSNLHRATDYGLAGAARDALVWGADAKQQLPKDAVRVEARAD